MRWGDRAMVQFDLTVYGKHFMHEMEYIYLYYFINNYYTVYYYNYAS